MIPTPRRCSWVPENDDLYAGYHDHEWGKPVHDSRMLFEMLCLEGAQAGLSWITILRRRDSYRLAFDNFDPNTIALYEQHKEAELLQNEGIIRNRLKVKAFIKNAKAYLSLSEEMLFSDYVWGFVQDTPLVRPGLESGMVVAESMSKDLKKRGFTFVGPTICYAFMQATGMIDDHEPECYLSSTE